MQATQLACRIQERRRKLFGNPDWNGIDYLEVAEDQRSLCVHFFGNVPEALTVRNVRIEGGRRIRDVQVEEVRIERAKDPELDDCLWIRVNKPGDFSTYRLCLVEARGDERPLAGMDPRYACLDFSFKVSCPSDLDCAAACDCPTEPVAAPEINYLAKDYASFRQLILDRLAFTMPEWRERHVPDLGITLVELLAYAADHLSYYQDAVATEAYLDTARLRTSVRRHARLVDYRMHEGCNARAWVTVEVSADTPIFEADEFYFVTSYPDVKSQNGHIVREEDLPTAPPDLYAVFEPLLDEQVRFRAAHNEIRFYTWGDTECCLEKGATRATLIDDPQQPLQLNRGDVLIFEEVLGPTTGDAADADPVRRHAVRLTKVKRAVDGLFGDRPVMEIEWGAEDALPFSLCLSARLGAPHCTRIENISVARGNVVLVDHGRTVRQPIGPVEETAVAGECACDGSVIEETRRPRPLRARLAGAPLTFAEPIAPRSSATRLLSQDVREALPHAWLAEFLEKDTDTATGSLWTARYDLLASGPDDRHFVTEIDDFGQANLRFGNGELGFEPAAGLRLQARYRLGNGTAGNVGRETITYLVLRNQTLGGIVVHPRNPLPAQGGTAAEPAAEVKLLAPHAFRNRLERAVSAADYSALAARDNPDVTRAATLLRWTGSWYEARVAVDPAATDSASADLLTAVRRKLFRYRRMGHDLAVVAADYVPLDLALEVCVLQHHARAQVKAQLLRVFGNGRLPDGTLGFFHPDNLSFGDGIHTSAIVARAAAIAGVETVKVSHLARRGASEFEATAVLDSGVLQLSPMEIARLDNDPSFPENGALSLIVRGGR